jgi:hypothetical protein
MTSPTRNDGAAPSKDSQPTKDPVAALTRADVSPVQTANRVEEKTTPDISDKETRSLNEATDSATTTAVAEASTTAAVPIATAATTTTTTPRLYIGNLHPRVTQVHLESLLHARNLGVEQIQFVSSSPTTPASFCFVTLPSLADASRAMQLLHGRLLLGRKLRVQPAHAPTTTKPSASSSLGSSISSSSSHRALTARQQQRSVEDRIAAIRDKLQRQTGR